MDEKIYDLIVIGGGPAGLTAGIYAGRAMLDVLVIEKDRAGGQINLTNEIVNYPGIIETSGEKFGEELKKQALGFGVNFLNDEVIGMELSKDIKIIKTAKEEFKTLSVVIATGASPRKLGFKGEKEFTGRGVAYCATCDGEFFTGLDVFVIGAGFAAAEEAIFLTKYARKVTVIAREPEFTCAKSIAEKVLKNPKIEVKFNTEILEVDGETQLKRAVFKNNVTNEIFEYNTPDEKTFGIFIFVGYEPQSRLFEGHVALDNYGYIPTDSDLMTNIQGVYAVGDVRPKKLKQVVTAVADGADAAMNIEKYVLGIREKLGLKKEKNKEVKKSQEVSEKGGEFLDSNLKEQLAAVAEKFENEIEIVLIKDSSNEKSFEMETAFKDIASVSEKIKFSSYEKGENKELEQKINVERFPTSAVLDKDGNFSGIKYSTVPGGHELNSFILAMYNVAGPGQKLSDETLEKIRNIKRTINVKVGISLSCSNCPETVQSVQRIAAENKNIQVEIIDVLTFRDFKDKHEIMSVPAMVVNDRGIFFGRKNIDEVLHFL